ncbi:MAG: hypothetical protein JNG85_12675 [Spirochaetaceae bacterium]|nr:hypothetical protein [Spirochaetaceae bacterium]
MSPKDPANGGVNAASGENVIQRLFSFFAGMGDPDAEKKKALKAIGKDLSRSRFKFYRPKGQEALPGLARFFYELYKQTAPAQVLLGAAATSGALRSFVIDSFLSEEQRKLSERLTEAAIIARAKTVGLKDLQEEVKNDLSSFYAVFDGEMTRQIDSAYNTLLSFINFVNFDFYFLLKKYDSTMAERSFAKTPRFEAITGDYVADDIEDFLEVFLPLDLEADWKRIFQALRDYKNTDIIQQDAWLKLVPAIAEVRKSQILEQIVRHIKRAPTWVPQPRYPSERIVEPHVQKLRAQIETLIQRLIQEKRNAKIDEVAKQVFGTTVVLRMKNYTEKANVIFAKKMLGGYTQAQAMNYLKAYLMDYFKKDIRELVDLLLIRGQWSTQIQSQQLSAGYHSLLEVSESILLFDESLADEGEVGARLKAALMKADRDKEQVKYLRTMLKDINEKAVNQVTKAAVSLITIGRFIKALIEDHEKTHHEMIINWKDVENGATRPVKEWLVEVYKKIYYMVQLLQFYMKEEQP